MCMYQLAARSRSPPAAASTDRAWLELAPRTVSAATEASVELAVVSDMLDDEADTGACLGLLVVGC